MITINIFGMILLLQKWLLMRNKTARILFVIGFSCCLFINNAIANTLNDSVAIDIKNLIVIDPYTHKTKCQSDLHCSSGYTATFYQNNGDVPVWSSQGHVIAQMQSMVILLGKAANDGLNPNDYHLDRLKQIYNLINTSQNESQLSQNIAIFDIVLTDGVFLYLSDLAYGRVNYKKNYPKWSFEKRDININEVFKQYLEDGNTQGLLQSVIPNASYYSDLKDKLARYQEIAAHGGFPIIPNGRDLKIGATGTRVKDLQKRLLISGELAPEHLTRHAVFNHELRAAVILFQKNNGIRPSGIVDKNTLKILNISINDRIKTINFNLDRMRMMQLDTRDQLILVNIPDYKLTLFDNESSIISMSAIVGNDKHQSCVLNSQISYLEINPYWNIPRSIAIKELLLKIILNPSYLTQKHIDTFLVESGNKLQIDPDTVDWSSVDLQKFPYFFRQNPGNSNALGKVKFVFPNNCGIYLHDTDEPTLFGNKKRDLSHGCIRISEPIKLATYLLQDKSSWSESAIESAVLSGKRRVVTLSHPEDVAITYFTSWVNERGYLQFRPDIYGLDN